MDVKRITDELAIRGVLAAYCHRVDDARTAELLELFTADGAFVRGAREIVGHAALQAFFGRSRETTPEKRGRHLTLDPEIEIDGDRARVEADYLYLGMVDGKITPVLAGRYHDELVRGADGRWRFFRRVVEDWPPRG